MNASPGAPASGQEAPTTITLKDVATIEPVTEQGEITRYNLNAALSMAITKSKMPIRLKWQKSAKRA